MTNWQLYLMALKKTWWLLGIIILGIMWTGLHELIELKWEKKED